MTGVTIGIAVGVLIGFVVSQVLFYDYYGTHIFTLREYQLKTCITDAIIWCVLMGIFGGIIAGVVS